MGAAGRTLSGFLALALLGSAAPATDAMAQRTPKGDPVPFEAELSKQRRDRSFLSFNEHISAVPGNRIRDLPVVNGRMGDRVTVGEGHTLHFPLGYLVTATYVFDKRRPRGGARDAGSAAELEPNPAYALVQRFDAELGPVCARTEDRGSDVKAEFRLRAGRTMALVLDMPGRFDALAGEKSRSYLVFVGAEERYVPVSAIGKKLLAHCRSGARDVNLPHDGSPLTSAQITGVSN